MISGFVLMSSVLRKNSLCRGGDSNGKAGSNKNSSGRIFFFATRELCVGLWIPKKLFQNLRCLALTFESHSQAR